MEKPVKARAQKGQSKTSCTACKHAKRKCVRLNGPDSPCQRCDMESVACVLYIREKRIKGRRACVACTQQRRKCSHTSLPEFAVTCRECEERGLECVLPATTARRDSDEDEVATSSTRRRRASKKALDALEHQHDDDGDADFHVSTRTEATVPRKRRIIAAASEEDASKTPSRSEDELLVLESRAQSAPPPLAPAGAPVAAFKEPAAVQPAAAAAAARTTVALVPPLLPPLPTVAPVHAMVPPLARSVFFPDPRGPSYSPHPVLMSLALDASYEMLTSIPPSKLAEAFGLEGKLGPTWMCVWIDPSVPTLQVTHEHFAHKTRVVCGVVGDDLPWNPETFRGKTMHEVDQSKGAEDFIAMKPMLMPTRPAGQPYVNTSLELSEVFQGISLLTISRTCFDRNNQCRLMFVSATRVCKDVTMELPHFTDPWLLEFEQVASELNAMAYNNSHSKFLFLDQDL